MLCTYEDIFKYQHLKNLNHKHPAYFSDSVVQCVDLSNQKKEFREEIEEKLHILHRTALPAEPWNDIFRHLQYKANILCRRPLPQLSARTAAAEHQAWPQDFKPSRSRVDHHIKMDFKSPAIPFADNLQIESKNFKRGRDHLLR